MNFTSPPERFRPVAKELFFALLAGQPGDAQPWQLPSITTVRDQFSEVKRFLDWTSERGHPSLASITADDLTAFAEHLITQGLAASTRQGIRCSTRLLWTLRAALASDQLNLDPTLLDGWDEPPARRGENGTARIPEPVMGPLLGWALRWVGDFADDLLRARDESAGLHAQTQTSRRRRGDPPARGVRERLIALLDHYRADRRPLPGAPASVGIGVRRRALPVNFSHLARELHCHPGLLAEPSLLPLVQAAADQLGVSDRAWLRTPVRATLDE